MTPSLGLFLLLFLTSFCLFPSRSVAWKIRRIVDDQEESTTKSKSPNFPSGTFHTLHSVPKTAQNRHENSNERTDETAKETSGDYFRSLVQNTLERVYKRLVPASSASSLPSFVPTPPRDLWDGMLGALKNVNRGCISGFLLIKDFGDLWYESAGVVGWMGGSVRGAVAGALVATGGILAGFAQLVQGVVNTPQAIQAFSEGKVWVDDHWEQYSLDEDMENICKEERERAFLNQATKTQKNLRSKRRVKAMEFYRLLQVSTDATRAQIRQAYYREALKVHPDKAKSAEDKRKSAQKFQKLSSAYQVLINEESRDNYDAFGGCYVKGTQIYSLDPHVFFAVTFGSYLVLPYVGELKVASVVDKFISLTNNDDGNKRQKESFSIDNTGEESLQQRRRVVDIALHLRQRVAPFVNGSIAEDTFRASCRLEAVKILEEGGDFGDSLLLSVGRALIGPSREFLGYRTSILGLHGTVSAVHSSALDVLQQYQTVGTLLETTATALGPLLDAFAREQQEKRSNDGSEEPICWINDGDLTFELIEKLDKSMPKAIRLVWQVTHNDIIQTLRDACGKLFGDFASKEVQLKRARGILLLGQEFYNMGRNNYRKDKWRNEDALRHLLETAVFAATMQQAVY